MASRPRPGCRHRSSCRLVRPGEGGRGSTSRAGTPGDTGRPSSWGDAGSRPCKGLRVRSTGIGIVRTPQYPGPAVAPVDGDCGRQRDARPRLYLSDSVSDSGENVVRGRCVLAQRRLGKLTDSGGEPLRGGRGVPWHVADCSVRAVAACRLVCEPPAAHLTNLDTRGAFQRSSYDGYQRPGSAVLYPPLRAREGRARPLARRMPGSSSA